MPTDPEMEALASEIADLRTTARAILPRLPLITPLAARLMPLLEILLAEGASYVDAAGAIRPAVYRQEVPPLDVLRDYRIRLARLLGAVGVTAVRRSGDEGGDA